MNIHLIIFSDDIENPKVFKDRINTLGETFYLFNNMVFVETEKNTQEVYDKISANEYEQALMLVLYVKNEMFGFWGRMNSEVWEWLEQKEEKTKDGLSQNYMNEIEALTETNLMLEQKVARMSEEIETFQKTAESLYRQNDILQLKIKKE